LINKANSCEFQSSEEEDIEIGKIHLLLNSPENSIEHLDEDSKSEEMIDQN
jgi:hypothetical protein